MKKRWKAKTLEEACQFSNGLWKGEKPPFVNVGVIRNTNFTKEGTLDDSDIAYLDVEARKLEKRRLQFGDIILEKSGGGPKQPVGRVALFDKEEGDFSFSNFTAALRVLNPDDLDFRYLHKFLHWTYLSGVTEGMQSHSTGIRNLDGDAYKAIQVTYPPLAEQQRIVGLLDEAFEGIATAKANAERNLQNARALFESHLQSVFSQRGPGWVEKPLAELCERITKGSSPKWQGISYVDAPGILFVTSENVGEYDILLEQPKYVEEKFNAKDKKSILKNGDVLTNIVGASIGRTAVFDRDDVANINQAVCLIRCEPYLLNNHYLTYLLNSPVFKQVLHDNEVNNARANLSLGFFSQLPVPMPPIPKQKEIVAKLDAFREETQRLARLYERKHAALEALKKSLLHRAFTGEL